MPTFISQLTVGCRATRSEHDQPYTYNARDGHHTEPTTTRPSSRSQAMTSQRSLGRFDVWPLRRVLPHRPLHSHPQINQYGRNSPLFRCCYVLSAMHYTYWCRHLGLVHSIVACCNLAAACTCSCMSTPPGTHRPQAIGIHQDSRISP